MPMHRFRESLAKSHAHADAPWWEAVYREAFPDLATMADVRGDGWWQRAGIDRVLVLTNSRQICVDEKVRSKDHDDFCLEYWSDIDQRIPGWIAKPLACDFIAYAFVPSQRCYLLPFQSLRRAWRNNRQAWVKQFKRIEAENDGYLTVSVAVPIEVLLQALGAATLVRWQEVVPINSIHGVEEVAAFVRGEISYYSGRKEIARRFGG